MAGNLELDAETYAEWEIDYLKVRLLDFSCSMLCQRFFGC